jgi:hypothetical protein
MRLLRDRREIRIDISEIPKIFKEVMTVIRRKEETSK